MNATDILTAIDTAIGDSSVGPDAMRCAFDEATVAQGTREPWAWISDVYEVAGVVNADAHLFGSHASMAVFFSNGYEASVTLDPRPRNAGRYELAVLRDGRCVYDTPITNDVTAGLDDSEVIATLRQVAALDAVGTSEDVRSPDEWCRITGTRILDADGWRGRNAKPWDEPITLAEFRERASRSTQEMRAYRPPVEPLRETGRAAAWRMIADAYEED